MNMAAGLNPRLRTVVTEVIAAGLIAIVATGCGAQHAGSSASSSPSNPGGSAGADTTTESSSANADGSQTHRSVTLSLDHPARIDSELSLLWSTVEDSRCPQGVTCVWAGEVAVGLKLSEGDPEPRAARLTLSPRPGGSARIDSGHWHIELTAVTPYPRDGQKQERAEYRAELRLTRD